MISSARDPALPGARRRRAAGDLLGPARAPPAEVEVLDGQLLVLSPWVVRDLRFDEDVFDHGFDVDFSLRVRRAGRKLLVADLLVRHHRSLELIADLDLWTEAHIRMAEKWDGALAPSPDDEQAWKERAQVRRGQARGGPGVRVLGEPQARRPSARARARAGAEDRQPVVADDCAAAGAQSLAEGSRRSGRIDEWLRRGGALSAPRISSLETTDCAVAIPARGAQPREPLGDRERARVQQPLQHRLLARERRRGPPTARPASSSGARAGRRGWPPAARGSGCDRTGRGSARRRRSTGGSPVPHHPEPEERRHHHQPQTARAPRRSPRPRSARRFARRPRGPPSSGRADRRDAARDRRDRCLRHSPATGWRLPARDLRGVEVVVAARVRPADVVEQQQRQLRVLARVRRSAAAPR